MMHYVYMLECADGSYYTGYTNDLEKRFKAHVSGKGAKYTRSHHPVSIVYYEEYEERKTALSREWHLKRLSHEEKRQLAQYFVANRKSIEMGTGISDNENKDKEIETG